MSIEDPKIPKSLHQKGKEGILSKVLVTEDVLAAKARGDSLIEQAKFNEAIRVIEKLEAEVTSMVMPQRFSRIAKPAESVYHRGGDVSYNLKNLTEDEYKRQTILMSLKTIKDDIIRAIDGMESVVLDIEATKKD